MHSKFIFIYTFFKRVIVHRVSILSAKHKISDYIHLFLTHNRPEHDRNAKYFGFQCICLVSYSVDDEFLYFESVFEGKYVGLKAHEATKNIMH